MCSRSATLCHSLEELHYAKATSERGDSASTATISTRHRHIHQGGLGPLVISGGEKAAENPAKPTNSGAFQKADEARARKAGIEPAVIVFGYNEHRIPQAAWFSEAEADLATRVARLMGLRVLPITDESHRELAARLRQGQVYAADRTFAPAVQRELFDVLCALAGPVAAPSPLETTARPKPHRARQAGTIFISAVS